MNNNFKTSLVIAPTCERHYEALRTKVDTWLTSKLILECRPNSNFSANHGDNENDQDNENYSDNKNEGNNPANKYMFKVNNRKKVLCLSGYLWTYFTPCSSAFDIDFEHVIVH